MSLENIMFATSPLTGRIYAGYTRDGRTLYKKIDVTERVINAVMMHLHMSDKEYECAEGELSFKPKEAEAK